MSYSGSDALPPAYPSPQPTPTGTICAAPFGYDVAVSSGATLVPGTVDIGNHCRDCTTYVALPFPCCYTNTLFPARSA